MSLKVKNILLVLLLLLVTILSIKLLLNRIVSKRDHSKSDSTIVVQRIQKVLKLVAVEANFSELLKYSDFDYVDIPGFRKDALINVVAKVSIGYNMENMKITTNEKTRIITIQKMPKPEILSIDTDIKFENINEGIFNSFNELELSKLNSLAKEKIRQKALSTELIRQADEQKNELFDLVFYMAKNNGYSVIVEGILLKPIISGN